MIFMQTLMPTPLTQIALISVLIYGFTICLWLLKLLAIDKAVVSPLIFLYPLMVLAIYMEFAVKIAYKYIRYFFILIRHKIPMSRRLFRLYLRYFVKSTYYYLLLAYKVVFVVVRHIINLFVR